MWDRASDSRRTAACAVGEHEACPHRMRLGGRLRRGAIPPELDAELCRCPCHSGCPLGGLDTAPADAWRESCRCAGSAEMREEEARIRPVPPPEPPDLAEIRRSMRARRDVHREIVEAVRPQAGGKSHREIRQLLVGEYESRQVPVPSEQSLDADAEFIAQGATPLAAARQLMRAMRGLGGAFRETYGIFANAQIMPGPDGKDAYFVEPDRSQPMADVILSADAGTLLNAHSGTLAVALERTGSEGGGPAAVRVYVGTHPVGTVGPQDGWRYQPALDAAQQRDQTLIVMGHVGRAGDGTPRMRIYAAGTR